MKGKKVWPLQSHPDELQTRHVFAYRPEIDGLRAVAVLSVILFHAGVPGAGGGYLGVDIFL